jgi:hypothetical protein
MAIQIRRVRVNAYVAEASPPHSDRRVSVAEPLSAAEIIEKLRQAGCHTTDIADALYAANPHWTDDVD